LRELQGRNGNCRGQWRVETTSDPTSQRCESAGGSRILMCPVLSASRTCAGLLWDYPGVEEGPSYGTPGFRVVGKLFARIKEDGVTLVVRTDRDSREALLEAAPSTFFVTPHYLGYDMMLIRLSAVTRAELRDQLAAAWRRCASKKLLAAFDSH